MTIPEWKKLRLEVVHNIATITLDDPDRSMNVFDEAMLSQLGEALEWVGERPTLDGLVIRSAKADFLAGADITEMTSFENSEQAEAISRLGHRVFGILPTIAIPTVAAIQGVCLGGGLELALACEFRVAADHPKTRLGLPEVKLGIVPAWGGCQRLPALVGVRRALDLILTGRTLNAIQAKRAGLIDDTARYGALMDAARYVIKRARQTRESRRLQRMDVAAANIPPLRKALFAGARLKTKLATHGHYPAPLKAIDAIEAGLDKGMQAGFDVEARAIGELLPSPTTQQLVRLFLLMEEQKKTMKERSLADWKPSRGGVLGAGIMGQGIAALMAKKGLRVRLRDVAWEPLRSAMANLSRELRGRVAKKSLAPHEAMAMQDAIETTDGLHGFQRLDVVIEAATENLEVKKKIVKELEAAVGESTIIATNTSSLRLEDIASEMKSPDRLVGVHFFNPVSKMPLIEIVKGENTSEDALTGAISSAMLLGKVPIIVSSSPGFLVNRVLAPYLNEAVTMLLEGASPLEIDSAMKQWGWPMGPFELLDNVGLDVAHEVGKVLQSAFGARMKAPPLVSRLLEAGAMGKKSGRGFYDYRRKSKVPGRRFISQELTKLLAELRGDKPTNTFSSETIVDRCRLLMLNEATFCLHEKVVASEDALDLASMLGIGFPPFRGGIMHDARKEGLEKVLSRLRECRAVYGPRFKPSPWFTAENPSEAKIASSV